MRCLQCNSDNELPRRFCLTCGSPLKFLCPECSFANEPEARFCGGCGASVDKGTQAEEAATEQAVQRRQVTVLFADLSGYTKLTNQLDKEDVYALMRRYFEVVDALVHHYGGLTVRHLGDAVMAVFGAPTTRSNDAERAVRTAIEIHRAMQDLSSELGRVFEVHIGVASGEVVMGAKDEQYDITGNSVNLASRLYDMAGPRETLLSEATFHAVAKLVDCETVGDIDVKGFDRPIKVRRLIKLDPGMRQRYRKPIVGRRMELSQLASIVQMCKSEHRGQTILIRGEAGIGKTRLLDELMDMAVREGFVNQLGLILDFGVEANQDPIRVAVQDLLGIKSTDTETSIRDAVDKAVDEHLIDDTQRVYLNDLIGAVQPRELHSLFDAMDNELRNQGKSDTLVKLLRNVAHRQPLLLAFEDIHWAGPILLDYLSCISTAAIDCPMLLVMTSRIEGNPTAYGWYGGSMVTIDLAALGASESARLASNFLEVSSRTVKECIVRAAGNPLFLEQLLQSTEDAQNGELPGSVRSIVMARIDQLQVRERHAIQAASVIGQRIDLGLLRHLIKSPGFDCQSLVDHHLVQPEGCGYLFTHALVREGVYGSLLKDQRRRFHTRAADWYANRDATLHAEHLEHAGDPRAVPAYLAAARKESQTFRYELALTLVDRGQSLAACEKDLCALATCRGQLLHQLGSIDAALDALDSALALAEGDVERCPIWIELAACLSVVDRFQEALEMLEKAEVVARNHQCEYELACIHHRRGNLFFPLGNIDGCLEQHHEACRLGRKLHDAEIEANALSGLGDASYQRGRMLTASEHYARCIQLTQEHGLGRIEIANRHMLGLTRYYQGQPEDAAQDCMVGAERAAQAGQQRAEMAARCSVGPILMDLGQSEAAYRESSRGLELSRSLGARRFEPLSLITMARVEHAASDTSSASKRLQAALEISRETGASFTGPWVLGATAAVTSDPAKAMKWLDEGEHLLQQGCVAHNYLWFYRDAMEVCLRFGKWTRLKRYVDALKSFTAPMPMPWSDFLLKRADVMGRYIQSSCDPSMRVELESLRDHARQLAMVEEGATLEKLLASSRQPIE